MRWTTFAFAGLLIAVQAKLWFGELSLPYTMNLHKEVVAQRDANALARERNQRTAAEVADLKEGLEMVEDKARGELGMLKPDEVLVQVAPARR